MPGPCHMVQARRGPSLHTVLLTAAPPPPPPPVCHAQILYRARDLDPEPRSHVVRGNHTQSALLAGLGKFVLYELQVLAFTRIGNGVPSSPPILERTKDDGTSTACLCPSPRFAVAIQTLWMVVIFNLLFETLFFLRFSTGKQNQVVFWSLSASVASFSRSECSQLN